MKTSFSTAVILMALSLCACSSSDNSYWPLAGADVWITQGWLVHKGEIPHAWSQNGRLRAVGHFEEEHGDWRVIEVAAVYQDRGVAYETIAGVHDDVLVLSIRIQSAEEGGKDPVDQTLRVWLARGTGPIHAEKTLEGILTGGDLLKG